MEESVVRVEHLSHRYSIQWAIRDINFEIPGRGVYGLLGSNGAGKSTLMNIICGVIKQTDGNVFIKGIDTRKKPIGAKMHIGFLPQQPPLYGELTVEEYLTHTAELRQMEWRDIRGAVEEVMLLCGISHFRKRLLQNLSGGYQQRVGIAQALVHSPDLVVLDEPTNGLDPNQIVEMRHLIKNIASEHTVILSTHILTEVQLACEHILMVEQGKLIFAGNIDEFDSSVSPSTLLVTFQEPPATEVLTALAGAQRVEELGGHRYRVYFTDVQEVIDQIVEQSAINRWRLSEMKQEKSSLDTIFSELSKKVNR